MDTQEMSQEIKSVLDATQKVVDSMKEGDRIQISALAQEVSVLVNKSPKDVLEFVNHFAHKTKVAYVTRGKHGGVVKGTRPAPKPIKVKAVIGTSVGPDAGIESV
jgi:hypothetical protein